MGESIVCAILCHDKNFGIGKNNNLPWVGKIPTDWKYYKEMVQDAVVITSYRNLQPILGKGDEESTLNLYHHLFVCTKNNGAAARDEVNIRGCKHITICDDLMVAIDTAKKEYTNRPIFLIGGAQLYNQAWQERVVDFCCVTALDTSFECDVKVDEQCLNQNYESTDDVVVPECWGNVMNVFKRFQNLNPVQENGISFSFNLMKRKVE